MRLSSIVAAAVLSAAVAACASKSTTAATPCALTTADSAYLQPDRPVYRDCAVERRAKLASTNVHPDLSGMPPRSRGTQCMSVDLEFVVDARGVPEVETARVVRATDDELGNAWMRVVPRLRYDPGTIGGTPVRQIVDQHFAAASATVVVPAGSGPPSSPPRNMPRPNC